MPPNFKPRELDGGVAWTIKPENTLTGDKIPIFKKNFDTTPKTPPESSKEDDLKDFEYPRRIRPETVTVSKPRTTSQTTKPLIKVTKSKKIKKSKKAKMPSSYGARNASRDRLHPRDNKATALRTTNRSRSPSPLPLSRSNSVTSISPLPGRRKDYSKGMVST